MSRKAEKFKIPEKTKYFIDNKEVRIIHLSEKIATVKYPDGSIYHIPRAYLKSFKY